MKTNYFLLFFFILLFGSCEIAEQVESSSIHLDIEDNSKMFQQSNGDVVVSFSSLEDSVSLKIVSSAEWTASYENQSDDSWCMISPMQGSSGTTDFIIKVTSISEVKERSTIININSGSIVRKISIIQRDNEPLSFGEGATLKENVRIYDAKFTNFILEYDDNQIILDNNITTDLLPKAGDIIVFPLFLSYRPSYIGKVVEINKNDKEIILKIDLPAMDDIFSNYTHDLKLNYSNVRVAVDPNSDGENYECRVVDNSVWDTMDMYIANNENTRISKGVDEFENIDFTIEIPVEKKVFTGSVYIRIHGNVNVLSTSSADMTLHQDIGLKGDLNWDDIPVDKKRIPILKGKRLPIMGTFVAGLMLKPEIDLFYEGEIKVQSGLNYQIVNNDFTCKIRNHRVESASTIEKKRNIYFQVKNIYSKGEFGVSTTGYLYYLVGDERLMSFGATMEAGVGIFGEGSVGIQFPDLDNFDFNISAYPFLTLSPWAQFGGKKYEVENMVQFKGNSFSVSLLPTFNFNQAKKTNSRISVNTDVNKQCFLSSKDNGVALFKKNSPVPIMKSSTNKEGTKSVAGEPTSQNYNLDFYIAENGEYEVAPYIETESGKIIFGKKIPVYPEWLEEFYYSTNGDNWIHNDNWLSNKSLSNWYGIINSSSIDLRNNNLTGNGIIRNVKDLDYMNLMGNNLQSLYIEDCPQIDPGYRFFVDELTLDSLVFNRSMEGMGQHFFGWAQFENTVEMTNIKKIIIKNVNCLGRIFFFKVKSDYIEFKNCNFSENDGAVCEQESQVNTLCFDNCNIPGRGRIDNYNGNIVVKNCNIGEWSSINAKKIYISNTTIEGYNINFSGTAEEFFIFWFKLNRKN